MRLIRYLPAHSIRDNGTAVQSPDVWLQSLPSCHVSIECLANGGDHVCVKTRELRNNVGLHSVTSICAPS